MGIIKNEHGVYQVRKKVPKGLEEAVARLTGADKPRVSWLKKSLGTKDQRQANIRAKPVLMEFDRTLERARASLKPVPVKASLSDHEIKRIAAYHFASMLSEDEGHRAGDWEDTAEYGLSERRFSKLNETIQIALAGSEDGLARGDISVIGDVLDELLEVHGFTLDPRDEAYRKLGMAVLRVHVQALRDTEARSQGVPIETPATPLPTKQTDNSGGGTLTAAFKGWAKAQAPSPSSLREYQHAVDRFTELHGDMAVVAIKRSHVLAFREALQDIPPRRTGELRNATLPALVEWRQTHINAPRINAGTVNKLLGGVQAVARWARDNGLIDDDTPWADPFANMRLEENDPDREPWETEDLVKLMASPVFAKGERPKAGGGEAAYWLPLLGMFTGARLGELAPLQVSDVQQDAGSGVRFLAIRENEEDGKRVKTSSSIRAVPIHPELVRLGFLDYVRKAAKRGANAPLFHELKPGPKGSMAEGWSKWFGRYIRANGIAKPVFHSFRHGFKDELRAAKVSEDMNDALTGHSGGGTGRRYGAKDMLRRYGAEALADAVAKVRYPGVTLPKRGL
jgi:integrase